MILGYGIHSVDDKGYNINPFGIVLYLTLIRVPILDIIALLGHKYQSPGPGENAGMQEL